METCINFSGEGELACGIPYREAVGCLIYVTVGTRPYISFANCRLATFVEIATNSHWFCEMAFGIHDLHLRTQIVFQKAHIFATS